MSSVWLNGKFIDESEATISLRDTGLLHSAGLFTTMRSYTGKLFRLESALVLDESDSSRCNSRMNSSASRSANF